MAARRWMDAAVTRLVVFGVIVLLAFGGGALLGATIGPDSDSPRSPVTAIDPAPPHPHLDDAGTGGHDG